MLLILLFAIVVAGLVLGGESPSTKVRHRIAMEGGVGPLGI
jgi:hypothetical protein